MTGTDEIDLLPCPFCGGEAGSNYVTGMVSLWRVGCDQCGANVEFGCKPFDKDAREAAKVKAEAAWNTRPSPSPVDRGELETVLVWVRRAAEVLAPHSTDAPGTPTREALAMVNAALFPQARARVEAALNAFPAPQVSPDIGWHPCDEVEGAESAAEPSQDLPGAVELIHTAALQSSPAHLFAENANKSEAPPVEPSQAARELLEDTTDGSAEEREANPGWVLRARAVRAIERARQSSPSGAREAIEAIVRDVAELPDRTSPDDWPEALIVTSEELALIVERHLSALPHPAGDQQRVPNLDAIADAIVDIVGQEKVWQVAQAIQDLWGLPARDQVREALGWIAEFARVRAADDSRTFARVNRGALRTIAEKATAALASPTVTRGEDK